MISSFYIEVAMATNNEILIIGPPGSGKTTFLAQLYGRLMNKKGKLQLASAPENIDGIKSAYNRLADGEETEATFANDNLEVKIPVIYEGQEFVLHCKDYGGEQVRDLVALMEYDNTWIDRAKRNDRWILFVRPSEIEHRFDLSKKGYAEKDQKETKALSSGTSDQSKFIELLQVLLHARGIGMKSPVDTPRLLIALTCWDELSTNSRPQELLQHKMPLFAQFVAANWLPGAYKIVGISAQEFPLKTEEARDKYLDEMPQNFGFLVLDDNPKEKDLTRLIEQALKL
jgi:energy-coupling factor transporter ATP-binding protein EcfA2